MIDLKNIAQAASNIRNRRTTQSGFLCKMFGGPLDGELKRLERIDRILTFTTDAGAVQYVRTNRSEVLTKYQHLTPEFQEQLDFDAGLEIAASIFEDTNTQAYWVLRFPYHSGHRDRIRDLGWRWDVEAREWFIRGSRSALAEALEYAKKIPNSELFCDSI